MTNPFAFALEHGLRALGEPANPRNFARAVAETIRAIPEGAVKDLLREHKQPDESWRETVARALDPK